MMNPDITTCEADMITQNRRCLTGDALAQRIVGKTILGDFGAYFKYITCFEPDGTSEGKNNAGAHHFGTYSIDKENHTVTVRWDSGWESSTTRAYDVDGLIKLFEVNSGQWRTTFTAFSDGCTRPLTAPQTQ